MRLAEIYPAKNRIFSPNRWEAWNKLPIGFNQTKNYCKISKIRRISEKSHIKPEGNSFLDLTFLNTARSTFSKTLYIQPKDNSDTIRITWKNSEKIKQNPKNNDCLIEENTQNEKYSYSVCVGNIDIRGKQIIQANLINQKISSHPSSARLKKMSVTKKRNLNIKLPVLTTPSPWQIINKSIEENLMRFQ